MPNRTLTYTYEHYGMQESFTGTIWHGAVFDRNGKRVCEVLNTCIGDANVYTNEDRELFETFTKAVTTKYSKYNNPLDEFVSGLYLDKTNNTQPKE